jgi:hypothetical protein
MGGPGRGARQRKAGWGTGWGRRGKEGGGGRGKEAAHVEQQRMLEGWDGAWRDSITITTNHVLEFTARHNQCKKAPTILEPPVPPYHTSCTTARM